MLRGLARPNYLDDNLQKDVELERFGQSLLAELKGQWSRRRTCSHSGLYWGLSRVRGSYRHALGRGSSDSPLRHLGLHGAVRLPWEVGMV